MVLDNIFYDQTHSVTFTNSEGVSKNTWTDWGLIPSSRHSMPVNGIWSNTVEVNGVNGQEDLVRMYPFTAVNSYSKLRAAIRNDNRDYILQNYGYDIYQPSSGSLSFIIADQTEAFHKKQQDILAFLHNRRVTMKFSDDETKEYVVRTSVEGFENGRDFSKLSIMYSVINEN